MDELDYRGKSLMNFLCSFCCFVYTGFKTYLGKNMTKLYLLGRPDLAHPDHPLCLQPWGRAAVTPWTVSPPRDGPAPSAVSPGGPLPFSPESPARRPAQWLERRLSSGKRQVTRVTQAGTLNTFHTWHFVTITSQEEKLSAAAGEIPVSLLQTWGWRWQGPASVAEPRPTRVPQRAMCPQCRPRSPQTPGPSRLYLHPLWGKDSVKNKLQKINMWTGLKSFKKRKTPPYSCEVVTRTLFHATT